MRSALIVLLCLITGISQPFQLRAADMKSGESVTISQRVEDDLYIAAGDITINAVVEGDIVVAGGTVYINDSVRQDVIVAGGEVEIRGPVGDDVRVSGGQVSIQGSVGGDLLAFAGTVRLEKDATIYGDLLAYAGSIKMSATVRGDAKTMGGDITIDGSVLGNLEARGGMITMKGMVAGDAILAADELKVMEPAQFSGNLRYWSEDGEIDLAGFMISGNPIFDPDLEVTSDFEWEYLGLGIILFWILSILSSIIVILLLVFAFPHWVKRTGEDTKLNWWKHVLYGLGFAIGVPVIIMVLFVTVIGIPIAILLSVFYGIIVVYGTTLGAIALASFIGGQIGQSWNKLIVFVLAIAFMIVFKVIGLIPILGWMITFLAGLYGVGALISNIKAREKRDLPPPPAPEQPQH